jgi:hypothetical protein
MSGSFFTYHGDTRAFTADMVSLQATDNFHADYQGIFNLSKMDD